MPLRTIVSPLAVYLPRKTMPDKKYILNLNNYRNWSYIVSNQIKQAYNEVMRDELEGLTLPTPISLHFVLWKSSKRKIDRANPLSIHEKMFCDALTHYGAIEDDNDEFIESTHYSTGGVDKLNPRVDVIITYGKDK